LTILNMENLQTLISAGLIAHRRFGYLKPKRVILSETEFEIKRKS